MQIVFKTHIESIFKKSDKFSDNDGHLYIATILQSIEKIDSDLIKLLLQDTEAKEKFFIKVDDVYVLEQNKLIEFFMQKDYMRNGSYTAYTNKIGLIKKDSFIKKFDDVVLAWPHKDCILEGGQTKDEQKKQETFYNEILSADEIDRLFEPKVLTNIKRYTKDGVEQNSTIKDDDNLIIKGNNLIALHSLKKKYAGKVKLIYIDPPYNTGNDSFKYNDNFNHSTWLTFMKNRLEVAREFLSDDGVIFIQCDDNEQAYLKVLMDEIFGDNFNNMISVLSSTPSGTKTTHRESKIIKTKDIILVYSKNKNLLKLIPQYTLQSNWDTHFNLYLDRKTMKIKSFQEIIVENKIYDSKIPQRQYTLENPIFKKFVFKHQNSICQTGKSMPENIRKKSLANKNIVIKYEDTNNKEQFAYNGRRLSFLSNSMHSVLKKVKNNYLVENDISKLVCDFWDDIDFNNTQNEGGISFPAGKKPEQLLYRIINMTTNPTDLVMDFHLGSGTTCAVAHKMGRRYIGIEQMDYIETIAVERLKKVIDGEQGGISKAVKWEGSGAFVYAELKTIENFQDVEVGALNKNMSYLPLGEIEDKDYNISDEEVAINKAFYGVDDA